MRKISFGIMLTVMLLVCVQMFGPDLVRAPYVQELNQKVHFPIYDSVNDLYCEDGHPASGPDWQDIIEIDVVRYVPYLLNQTGVCVISLTVNGEFPSMETFWDGAIMILIDIDGDGKVIPSEGAIGFYEGNLDYGIFIPSPEFGEPPIFIQDLHQGPSGPYDIVGATYLTEGNRIEIDVELSHIGSPDGVMGIVAAIRTGITTDLVEDRVPNEAEELAGGGLGYGAGLGYTQPGYELFGPRADRIIMKTYENATEMLSALEKGELDIAYDADGGSVEYSQYYTGGTNGVPVTPDDGENKYRGKPWVNIDWMLPGGDIHFFNSITIHPLDYELGDGKNMTIRYGCTLHGTHNGFNVIYTYELGGCYPNGMQVIFESLVKADPYTLRPMPWLVEDYTIGTWLNTDIGENCSKVKFTLRPDITWHDGKPLTTADVYFTLVELPRILEELGYPPPAWIDNVANITDLNIIDPYNFEVLYWNVVSDFGADVIQTCILPMHVWKPIVEEGDPTSFAPDPNMLGSGPWRFTSYDSSDQLTTLEANRPGSTVQTNLPGSEPVTSPEGYWNWISSPGIPIDDNLNKKTWFDVKSYKPADEIDLSKPNGTVFYRQIFGKRYNYTIKDWEDRDGDGLLSENDKVELELPSGDTAWYTVEFLLVLPGRGPHLNMRVEADPQTLHMIFATVVSNLCLDDHIGIEKYVCIDDSLWSGYPKSLTISPSSTHTDVLNMSFSIGLHKIEVATYIRSPGPWAGRWENVTKNLWVTIKEDIVGSNFYDDIGLPDYPYKGSLPTPDFKVNINDLFAVAAAFGTVPSEQRWNSVADVNEDYKVDIKDIFLIAKVFGWVG